ncbi:unnamed protein product [Closterium sp. NIES-65]|nr:unnamed protein product [Closterium sp. NIES-65]
MVARCSMPQQPLQEPEPAVVGAELHCSIRPPCSQPSLPPRMLSTSLNSDDHGTLSSPHHRIPQSPLQLAWSNLWLLAAITLSMSSTSSSSTSQPSLSSSLRVHSRLFLMLTSSLPSLFLFFVGPLSWPEWRAVLLFSFPARHPSNLRHPPLSLCCMRRVIIVDEMLKIFSNPAPRHALSPCPVCPPCSAPLPVPMPVNSHTTSSLPALSLALNQLILARPSHRRSRNGPSCRSSGQRKSQGRTTQPDAG